ncbi:MAG: AgmX/PglI C-terminal domain-containing protein [Myxococcales bacterium]|jgi:outer membrane biosynthesis protein TonB
MANSTLVLKIVGPDGSVHEVTKEDADSVILGSGPAAAVKIEDEKVAGLHCMIKLEGGAASVIDFGSETGTKVGGQAISAPTPVKAGDVIEIGSVKVELVRCETASAEEKQESTKPEEQKASEESKEGKKGKKGKKEKHAKQEKVAASPSPVDAFGTVARLFNEELPPEETPAQDSKQLEVAMLWGDTIINVRHFTDDQRVTIGASRRNHFNIYSTSIGESFALASCNTKECVVSVPASANVVLRRGDSEKTREQLSSEGALKATDGAVQAQLLTLQLHDRVQVTIDNVAFIIRWVRPHKLSSTGISGFDLYFTKVMTTSAMAGIVLVAAMFMTDITAESLSEDLFKNPQRFAKLVIKPPEKEKKKIELKVKEKQVKVEREPEKYGARRDENAKPGPTINANKREADRKKVMSAGLLGLLGGGDGATSNVFGQGGMGTGLNSALGSLKDSGVADTGGIGGLGSRGTGPGGGGTGLGLAGLGTKGGGRGARGGYGAINLGGRGKSHTRVVPGKTTLSGSCERTVISKVINRHANEIRYCYEMELNKDPSLSGKVAVMFTIDPTGSVSEANIGQTTMNNNNVEQCILTRIRRWRFPEPKGGGVCIINYPWVFKAAGSDDDAE